MTHLDCNAGRKKAKLIFLTILGPLFFGAIFYYVCCPDVFFVKSVDRVTNLSFHIPRYIANKAVIRFLRNYLLDLIWAFALANAVHLIYWDSKIHNILVVAIPSFVGIILELLQKFELTIGTFDFFDIISEVIGSFFALLIIFHTGGKNEKI